MAPSKFSRRMRSIRLAKNITQGEIAQALGVTTSFYSSVEVGKRPPTAPMLNLVVSMFDLDIAEASMLHNDAAESIDQVRINTQVARPKAQQVALSLARRFESLNDEQLDEINEVLFDD